MRGVDLTLPQTLGNVGDPRVRVRDRFHDNDVVAILVDHQRVEKLRPQRTSLTATTFSEPFMIGRPAPVDGTLSAWQPHKTDAAPKTSLSPASSCPYAFLARRPCSSLVLFL
jgi:hypothetical protein